jgi:hypothetical protein
MKRAILLKLVHDMRETVEDKKIRQSLSNIADTVVHTAPEILDNRWRLIYNLCATHLGDNKACFELYSNAMEKYKAVAQPE